MKGKTFLILPYSKDALVAINAVKKMDEKLFISVYGKVSEKGVVSFSYIKSCKSEFPNSMPVEVWLKEYYHEDEVEQYSEGEEYGTV